MTLSVTVSELFQACNVLFQPDFNYSVDFINALDSSSLKVAFRKKALATHPDRSERLGCCKDDLNKKFVEVTKAYDVLSPVVSQGIVIDLSQIKPDFHTEKKESKKKARPRKDQFYSGAYSGAYAGKNTHDRSRAYSGSREGFHKKNDGTSGYHNRSQSGQSYYRGTLPKHKLLLGQFLYYSGVITWKQLIDSIVWQKNQGLLFGQIAKKWSMLTDAEIYEIIRGMSYKEKIGEYATRKGYLTKFQTLAILGKQSLLRQPIGGFFIEKSLLTERQIDQAVEKLYQHNMKFF